MTQIGTLHEADGRYEFRIDQKNLIVRGDHPEWVIQAASEILSSSEKLEAESKVEELETLVEFEAATEIEVDSAKFALKERFDTIPQCMVTLGKLDYKWAAPIGRKKLGESDDGQPIVRVHDMSLTYNDTFLEDEEGTPPHSEV